jgi:UDP-glucose 4-epimerase
MGRTILVTGGAGYVGSTVASELVAAGHRVIVFDNLSKGHRAAIPEGADLVVGDLADQGSLERTFAATRFDAVMHFAAFIEAGESMQVPERFFRNNTANTMNLLEAMLAAKVPCLVFSSTAALYGDPERVPIEEDDRLRPTNVYGESKLLVEQMLAWYQRIHGLRYASLRYFNAAGGRPTRGEDHAPESHLIPLVLQVAQGKRDDIKIFGTDYDTPDGTCVRDYVHVADLASAHLLALDRLCASDGRLVYNLGNGQGFSVRQVIDVARKVTGHPIPAVEHPRRPGDPGILVASSAKIRRELGWAPRFPEIEQIVRSAWEWHRDHPQGYADR